MTKPMMLAAVTAALLMGAAPASAEGDAEEGSKIFRRCQACHTVQEGQHRVGPSLYGVIGRQAATAEGFNRYSTAMKDSGIVWDEETLDAYLADPRGFIPGNMMAFPGLPNPQDRANVIEFLEHTGEDED